MCDAFQVHRTRLYLFLIPKLRRLCENSENHVIARSAALAARRSNPLNSSRLRDCFASLAMTKSTRNNGFHTACSALGGNNSGRFASSNEAKLPKSFRSQTGVWERGEKQESFPSVPSSCFTAVKLREYNLKKNESQKHKPESGLRKGHYKYSKGVISVHFSSFVTIQATLSSSIKSCFEQSKFSD